MRLTTVAWPLFASVALVGCPTYVSSAKDCHEYRFKNGCLKHDDRCEWPIPDQTEGGCFAIGSCPTIMKKGKCSNSGCLWSNQSMGSKVGPYCKDNPCSTILTESPCKGNHLCFWKNGPQVCVHQETLPAKKWVKCGDLLTEHGRYYTPDVPLFHLHQQPGVFLDPLSWAGQQSMGKYSFGMLLYPGDQSHTFPGHLPLVEFGDAAPGFGATVTMKKNGHVTYFPAGKTDFPSISLTCRDPLPFGEFSFVMFSLDLTTRKLRCEVYGSVSGKKSTTISMGISQQELLLAQNVFTLAPYQDPSLYRGDLFLQGIVFSIDKYLKPADLWCGN